MCICRHSFSFFYFNATAPTEIYTLSLHDALPICVVLVIVDQHVADRIRRVEDEARVIEEAALNDVVLIGALAPGLDRSEEHTSELQSRRDLVCRLLLEKKNRGALRRDLRQHKAS